MLTINDSNFRLKNKELTITIDKSGGKIVSINILTFLGVFNDYMDDINIEIKFNTNIRSLNELTEIKDFTFETTSNNWQDRGNGIIIINNINANKLEAIINLKGEYDYHIETILEATWLTLDNSIPFEEIDKYIDSNEIENIPFITDKDKTKIIQYMFKKEKVTYNM